MKKKNFSIHTIFFLVKIKTAIEKKELKLLIKPIIGVGTGGGG